MRLRQLIVIVAVIVGGAAVGAVGWESVFLSGAAPRDTPFKLCGVRSSPNTTWGCRLLVRSSAASVTTPG